MLVEHGADTATQDEHWHGSTPLHLSSRSGHVGLSRTLIEHGANGAAQDVGRVDPIALGIPKGSFGDRTDPLRRP
jgi:hypothetical protein